MKKKKGFTLIEMILVIALIVILTTIATASLASYITNARTVSAGAESHQNKYLSARNAVDALGKGGLAPAVPPAMAMVTLNLNGGSGAGDFETTIGSTISEPAAPTKAGSTFGGWYSDVGCSILWNFSTDTVTGNMTLYAKWPPVSPTYRTVTFDPMGGSTVPPVSTTLGTAISAPPQPTKAGNTFTGWYKESSCTTLWNFPSDTVTGDTTLFAGWLTDKFTVTYNSQGGSAVGSVQVNSGGLISPIPASPTWTGRTFISWCKDSSGNNAWNFSSDTVTASITLYAKWTSSAGTPCTITFNSQGDSYVAPINATTNATISAPATPTKYDYTFVGWYTDSSGTNAWNFSSVVTGNMTLYGKWIKIPTITFETQGGSYIAPLRPAYNTTISAPAVPTKYNVTFGGWYTNSACTTAYNFASVVTGDMTLYAKWTCHYKFDMSGTPANVKSWPVPAEGDVTAGSALTISTTPTRTGKKFEGWYTSTYYNASEKWISGSVLNGNITLYAKWK